MGCLNSSNEKQPRASSASVQYNAPQHPAVTPSSTQFPSHQQVSQQPSQHRISVSSGVGSHNGSIGYNQPTLPSVPPPLSEEEGSLFVARYAYQARTAEDLSFEKGEKLKVSCC